MKKRAISLVSILLMFTFLLSSCTMKDADEELIEMEHSLKEGETTDVWGIQLSVRNITSTGMTLICQQSGGDPTGELHTGSYYYLEEKLEGDWVKVERLELESDVGWTDEAWIILMEDTVEWEIDWEWLYGELPIGRYRIGKEIT